MSEQKPIPDNAEKGFVSWEDLQKIAAQKQKKAAQKKEIKPSDPKAEKRIIWRDDKDNHFPFKTSDGLGR